MSNQFVIIDVTFMFVS